MAWSSQPIPPLLHLMWFQGMEQAPQTIRENVDKWKRYNPAWVIRDWDEKRIRMMIRNFYPEWLDYFYEIKGSTDLATIIKKCDFARLLIMHQYGGVYADLDLECQGSLDNFLVDPWLYNKDLKDQRKLPLDPHRTQCHKQNFEVILSREVCRIDRIGRGVANGILIGKPGAQFWMDFLNEQKESVNGRVLDFVGTWALTRYVRANANELKGQVVCIPPHYFLWEPKFFKDQATATYTVSVHPAQNTWGDHSQKAWWAI